MPGIEAPLSEAGATCVHAYRAGDFAMEMFEFNMPGTDREHPNRRRKLRLPVQTPRLDRPKRSSKRSGANAKRRPAPGRAVNMDKEHVKGAARAVRWRHQGCPTQSRRQHQALTLSPEFQVSIGPNGLEPPLSSRGPAKTLVEKISYCICRSFARLCCDSRSVERPVWP